MPVGRAGPLRPLLREGCWQGAGRGVGSVRLTEGQAAARLTWTGPQRRPPGWRPTEGALHAPGNWGVPWAGWRSFELARAHEHVGPLVPRPLPRCHGPRAATGPHAQPDKPRSGQPGSLAAACGHTALSSGGTGPAPLRTPSLRPEALKGRVPRKAASQPREVVPGAAPGVGWSPSVLASGSGPCISVGPLSEWKSMHSVLFCKSCSKDAREMITCLDLRAG